MANVTLTNVSKSFGDVQVISDVSLSVDEGEFVVFVGPSGCGKSTLLRMIAGLEDITNGTLSINGQDFTTAEPSDRHIAMVFQSYALYPHMSVRRNLGFALRMSGMSRAAVADKVEPVAAMLQLTPLLDRKPSQLSGGQRQRVAIGRALVRSPRVFLFDEPLSNLDAELRVQMRVELAQLHKQIGITTIYVTHDQVEAMTLAHRIVVIRDGRIEQVGAPLQLYDDPDTQFVAGFIGSPRINQIACNVVGADESGVVLGLPGDARLEFPLAGHTLRPGDRTSLAIRPERLAMSGEGSGEGGRLTMQIDYWERLGGVSYAYGSLVSGERMIFEQRLDRSGAEQSSLHLTVDPARAFLFDATGKRLRSSMSDAVDVSGRADQAPTAAS